MVQETGEDLLPRKLGHHDEWINVCFVCYDKSLFFYPFAYWNCCRWCLYLQRSNEAAAPFRTTKLCCGITRGRLWMRRLRSSVVIACYTCIDESYVDGRLHCSPVFFKKNKKI